MALQVMDSVSEVSEEKVIFFKIIVKKDNRYYNYFNSGNSAIDIFSKYLDKGKVIAVIPVLEVDSDSKIIEEFF